MWALIKSFIPHKHIWVTTGTVLTTDEPIDGEGHIQTCTWCENIQCINMKGEVCKTIDLCQSIAAGKSQVSKR